MRDSCCHIYIHIHTDIYLQRKRKTVYTGFIKMPSNFFNSVREHFSSCFLFLIYETIGSATVTAENLDFLNNISYMAIFLGPLFNFTWTLDTNFFIIFFGKAIC